MAALTAARLTDTRNHGKIRTLVMAASTQIWRHGMVMINAAGLAVPAADTASAKGVAGIAMESVLSAATGTYYIRVLECEAKLPATSIAQANVGSLMQVADDQTFDESSTNSVPAGILTEYLSATEGWIACGLGFIS